MHLKWTREDKLKNYSFSLLVILASISLISFVGLQDAAAHQLFLLFGNPDHGVVNDVFMVIGHTNEPAYGNSNGAHDGKHNVEISLSDDATSLPLSNAVLMIDKYYFKDIEAYKQADDITDATQTITNVPIGEAFGNPGHYVHRQVIESGIYGYRVHGTIDYFGVGHMSVDVTAFCNAAGMTDLVAKPTADPTLDKRKFETTTGGISFGEYGCPEPIDDISFPKRGHR